MNFAGVAMMIVVLVAAVAGLYLIAAGVGTTPYVDSSGNTTNSSINATQQTMGNMTGAVPTIGTGIVILLAILAVMTVAAIVVGSVSGTRNRY